MLQNILYDLIIVGATKHSYYLLNKLKAKKPNAKVAVISTNFDQVALKYLDLADRLTDTVLHLEYFRGLVKVYLKNGVYCAKNILISTGTTPTLTDTFINKKVKEIARYNAHVIPDNASESSVMVLGSCNAAFAMAADLAEQFKQVYVCLPKINLRLGTKLKARISKLKNITIFKNTTVMDYRKENDKLTHIILDTYAEIECNMLIVVSDRKPAIPSSFSRVCQLNDKGAVVVDGAGNTSTHNIFALGSCTSRYLATTLDTIVDNIIKNI